MTVMNKRGMRVTCIEHFRIISPPPPPLFSPSTPLLTPRLSVHEPQAEGNHHGVWRHGCWWRASGSSRWSSCPPSLPTWPPSSPCPGWAPPSPHWTSWLPRVTSGEARPDVLTSLVVKRKVLGAMVNECVVLVLTQTRTKLSL